MISKLDGVALLIEATRTLHEKRPFDSFWEIELFQSPLPQPEWLGMGSSGDYSRPS